MRIALITIHHANSYGGCLQALASQVILSKYGESVIIDYKSPGLRSTMRLLRFSRNPRSALHVIKDIARFLPRKRLLAKFKKFMATNYNLTKPCNTEEDLKSLNNEFDYFVCGSDQIWNPAITGGFDKSYLLDFVSAGKCVSFSTSSGFYQFNSNEKIIVKEAVARFKSLSFRENYLVESISSISGRADVWKTLDPTLLLDREQWLSLLHIDHVGMPDKYVFVYTLKKDKVLYDIISSVASKLNLKVVAVDQDPFLRYKADIHIRDADPSDFVRLIAGAQFVITNSFHGTAFALNFGVPFLTIRPESGSNRVMDLLDSVDLSNRFVQSAADVNSAIFNPIDFSSVHYRLNQQRLATKKFLDNAFV